MLSNGNFWIGLILGIILHIAYQRYKMNKSQS